MAGFTYKSYNFTEKDPIIDEIRTIYQDSGANYTWIQEHSGVSTATLVNWFSGTTKRPQAATVNAVLRCLGYKLGIVGLEDQRSSKPTGRVIITPPLPQPKPRLKVSVRHVVQMKKYRRVK